MHENTLGIATGEVGSLCSVPYSSGLRANAYMLAVANIAGYSL